jgi:hypothetical protein
MKRFISVMALLAIGFSAGMTYSGRVPLPIPLVGTSNESGVAYAQMSRSHPLSEQEQKNITRRLVVCQQALAVSEATVKKLRTVGSNLLRHLLDLGKDPGRKDRPQIPQEWVQQFGPMSQGQIR